jgi:NAD(P)-dependent dehydrogenase (short-subunit alcohol dehydrogenase family)
MKILVVGGTGAIGRAVVKELSQRHTVVTAGREHGNVRVDITDRKSIEAMYQTLGKLDAVIATTGGAHFAPLSEMTAELYQIGLQSKLMGQVNLVLVGFNCINKNGSFTLTSGILNCDPIRSATSSAMVNGALEGFVKSAAIDMPNGTRINAVSPTVLSESIEGYGDSFRGFVPVPAAEVALAYSKSVEGAQTGQVYRVGYG